MSVLVIQTRLPVWILSLSVSFFLTATDLINNLLQVKMRKRYSVDKSLSHPWLQVTKLTDLWKHGSRTGSVS